MKPFVAMTYALPLGVLLVGVLMFFTPKVTRPDIWFSVTVDADLPASAAGLRILRAFRAMTALSTAAALPVVVAGLITRAPALIGTGMVVQVVGQALAFFAARRRTLAHATPPSAVRDAALEPRRNRLPGGLALQAGPFLVLAVGAAWIGSRWSMLPPRFPIHWDFSGHADGWATRSMRSVFGPIVEGFVLCGLLVLLGWGLQTRSRRISPVGDRARAEQRFRFVTLAVLLGGEYLVAAIFAVLTALPMLGEPSGILAATMWATLVFVVATVVVLGRVGQGGSRLVTSHDADRPPIGDRTADASWRGGFVYANRSDPALFVEKRFGLGYTVNFGNPWSWVILAALLIVPIAVACLMRFAS
jgi:uncharacterized membrane protein